MELPDLGRPLPEAAVPGEPPSIVELVRRGAMDAELAAIIWVLVEGRIPLVVAAPERLVAGSERLVAAPERLVAAPERLVAAPEGLRESGAATDILRGILASLRPDLGLSGLDELAITEPLTSRSARAIVHGERPGGLVLADSLQAVRDDLGSNPPLGLTDDELSFLGCVLVLGEDAAPPVDAADPSMSAHRPIRVVAAHYVRPLHRDEHGHSQQLGPAVLATWEPARSVFEHFAWGVLPEIAARLGRKAGDLEADLHHRRDDIGGLATAGVTSLAEVGRLIAGYRVGYGHAHDAKGH